MWVLERRKGIYIYKYNSTAPFYGYKLMFSAVKIPEITQKSVFFCLPICTISLKMIFHILLIQDIGPMARFSYQLLWCIFCILCDINVKKYYIYLHFISFIFLFICFLSHSPSNFAKTKLSLKLINWLQNLHYHPNTKTYSPSKRMGTHFPQRP